MSTKEMALAAYRHVLRSTKVAFQGDNHMILAARNEARRGFEKNKHHAIDSEEISKGIQHAEDVAKVLLQNVVQGRKKDEDTETYKLRIHEGVERGDNETIDLSRNLKSGKS